MENFILSNWWRNEWYNWDSKCLSWADRHFRMFEESIFMPCRKQRCLHFYVVYRLVLLILTFQHNAIIPYFRPYSFFPHHSDMCISSGFLWLLSANKYLNSKVMRVYLFLQNTKISISMVTMPFVLSWNALLSPLRRDPSLTNSFMLEYLYAYPKNNNVFEG